MLYTLGHPETFLLLLIGLLLAWAVHVGAQRLVQSRMPETKWLLQHRPGAAGFIDPFSAVAAVLGPASAGWTPNVEWTAVRGSRRPFVVLLLSGPLGNLLAGGVALIGFAASVRPAVSTAFIAAYGQSLGSFVDFAQATQRGGVTIGQLTFTLNLAQRALLLFGILQLLVGAISLIPLPPLEGGRLLFLFTPKSIGWQKAEYQLAERNIGLIILLAGLVKISSGLIPPFAYLGDVVAHGLASLIIQI